MVKLLAHVHWHMLMCMHGDAMLPFAEKASNERPVNDPLWQPRIVYPTTLMETIPPLHPLKREA